MPSAPQRCARHPGARAGWTCHRCQAALCPGCVFVRSISLRIELVCCTRCGEQVEALTLRRSEARSFAARLPGALAATFSMGGALTLLGTAAVMWALGHFGLPGAVLRGGVFWGFLFTAIRRASRGEPGLEPSDLSDVWHDLVRPALVGLIAGLVVAAPAILWVVLRPAGPGAPVLVDPVVWILLAAGGLYVPMTLMQAALGATLGQMVHPAFVIGAAVRLGRDYLLAVAVCAGLVVAGVAVSGLGARLVGEIPVVSGLGLELLGLLGPALLARTLGLLLYVRGDDVGLGVPGDYREPALPGAAPRGSPPAPAAAPPPAPRPEPIELPVEPHPPPPAAGSEAQIAERVAAGDLAAAARLYAALRVPVELPAAVLFQVARGAAGAGAHALAARALQGAARTLDPAVAPDALLVLARLCLHHLNRPADARAALDVLLTRFPDAPAARRGRELRAQVPG